MASSRIYHHIYFMSRFRDNDKLRKYLQVNQVVEEELQLQVTDPEALSVNR